MKKLIPVLLVTILINISVDAQTWRAAMSPGIQAISGGSQVDQNTYWIAGVKQGIYQTTDGGVTWVRKYISDPSLSTYYSLSDISFGSNSVGYAAGNKGRVLKTTNSGDTWQVLYTPDTTYNNKSIKFFSATSGYVLSITSTAAILYKTTDGGTTWTTATTITGAIESFDFYSMTKGILVGGGTTGMLIYYTTDGTTWTKATAPTIPPYGYSKLNLHTVKYVTDKMAYGCGWGSYVGVQPSIFVKTTDGGVTWIYQDQIASNRVYANIYGLFFKDTLNGIAAGQYTYPGTLILKTTDGGANWVPGPVPFGFSPSIILGSANKIIMTGGGGNIFTSPDFGVTWANRNPMPNETMYAISVKNNNIYVAGWESTFYKSTDHGNTFNSSPMGTGTVSLVSKATFFVNDNVGYSGGQYKQILKTTNGGTTWNAVLGDSNATSMSHQGIYFFNENKGMVVGYSASNTDIIYNTTDGGATWRTITGLLSQNLYCVDFADATHGAIGGNKAKILYTTDGGNTWLAATVNTTSTAAVNSITFYDGLNAIAVGNSLVLNTTDGGANWNTVTTPALSASLSSVCHLNATTLYAGGGKFILKSTDAGKTWQNIMDTILVNQGGSSISVIALDNQGFLWTAGGGYDCKIFTNAPATGIKEESYEPNSFNLEQNYPNPFNPSTVISFNLNKHGFVTLKLFDALGREVRELYSGEMSAGLHKINFNAASLSSGVYFYSLQVNNQFTSRKMTLLK